MVRKIITLVVLFVVFYMSAHYYIRWKNTVTDDVTKISRLVECHPNDLRALRIQQRTEEGKPEELSFERVDQPQPGVPAVTAAERWEWKYVKPFPGEAEPVLIRRIASTICELYDPISLRDEDMKPDTMSHRHAERLEATLATKSGPQNYIFEFGAVSPDHSNVIRFTGPGGTRVLRIPDHFLQAASLTPEAYRNLRVMRLEADNVERAELKIDGKERFTLERAGADWKVLLGGKEKGEGSEEASRFINRVSTLRAIGVDSPEYSPKDCESSPAKAVLNMHGVAGREEILRFNYGKAGDVAACSSARTMKFRVHHDLLQFLDIPMKSVLAKPGR